MNYKILDTTESGEIVYAKIDDDGVVRLTCSANYPPFQEWLAEGNEPLPADEPS